VGTIGDDVIEDLVEAEDAAVLALDAAEFHGMDYSTTRTADTAVAHGDLMIQRRRTWLMH
jgi:hypothetical protein